jgi:catechol 2,3-dioxygenase-like lactoylglutathione lyase family enzyme
MKLASARLVTSNVPALGQFYREITGITPVGSEEYLEIRSASGITLALCSQRAMALFGASAAVAAANRSVILDFCVADVDRERARLRSLLPRCVLEPTTQPWGNRSMLFRDPDGNLISFFARHGRS